MTQKNANISKEAEDAHFAENTKNSKIQKNLNCLYSKACKKSLECKD